jgi:hypothetical protein
MSLTSLAVLSEFDLRGNPCLSIVFHPDGEHLVLGMRKGRVTACPQHFAFVFKQIKLMYTCNSCGISRVG